MVVERSISSRFLGLFVHFVVAVVLISVMFPVLNILSNSVSDTRSIVAGRVSILPVGFTLANYRLLIADPIIPRSFLNSVIITVMGTAINLALTVTMAYPLSKRRLPFRRFFTVMVIITMFFSGGLIPRFMVVRALGMYNTYWALTLPIGISAFNLIILRTFFKQIPAELEESAFLDGAKESMVLLKIVMPLAKAGVATIALFYAVGHWNAFFDALIYLYDGKKYPMQLILRDIVIRSDLAMLESLGVLAGSGGAGRLDIMEERISIQGVKYGVIALTVIPMLFVYPFMQKYFVKGILIGSLKD